MSRAPDWSKVNWITFKATAYDLRLHLLKDGGLPGDELLTVTCPVNGPPMVSGETTYLPIHYTRTNRNLYVDVRNVVSWRPDVLDQLADVVSDEATP